MKPIDLYKREPIKTEPLSEFLSFRYDKINAFFPDLEEGDEYNYSHRATIHYYKDYCFDGRRGWVLASISFEGDPVMVVQMAGRENEDHLKCFITNEPMYNSLVQYMKTLAVVIPETNPNVVNANDDIEDLTKFYSVDLDDDFDLHKRLYW